MTHKEDLVNKGATRLVTKDKSISDLKHTESSVDLTFTVKLDKSFLCYYCFVELLPMGAKLQEFEIEKGAIKQSHAVDIFYRCPECGLQQVFGVAITEEQYEQVKPMAHEIMYE